MRRAIRFTKQFFLLSQLSPRIRGKPSRYHYCRQYSYSTLFAKCRSSIGSLLRFAPSFGTANFVRAKFIQEKVTVEDELAPRAEDSRSTSPLLLKKFETIRAGCFCDGELWPWPLASDPARLAQRVIGNGNAHHNDLTFWQGVNRIVVLSLLFQRRPCSPCYYQLER